MKKILFASIIASFLFSCNRDDSSSTDTTTTVTGKWKLTTYVILNGTDKKTLYSETNSGCVASNRYEFKTDGTYSFTYYNYINGTCSLSSTETGTYTYDDTTKKLTTIKSGVSTISDVYSLSAAEMQVKTGEVDYNNDGTQDLKITVYTKQ